MHRIGNWCEDHCPRCKLCEETHHHLLQCQHERSQLKLIEGIGKIRDWMSKMMTPQQLADQIVAKIQKELQMPHTSYLSTHPLIVEQQKIGKWFHFMEGRISNQFRVYLDDHYHRSNENKTGEMWVSGIIQRIWTQLYRPIWELRNQCVHRKTDELQQTREREDQKERVTKLFSQSNPNDFLSTDRHLFGKPLVELLKSSNMVLKAWLFTIDVATKARDKVLETDKDESIQTLRAWMRPKSSASVRKHRRNGSRVKNKVRISSKKRKQLKHPYSITNRKQRIGKTYRKQLSPSYIRIDRRLRSPQFQKKKIVDKEFLRRTGSFRPP